MKTVGWFQVVIGVSVAALWAVLLATGVPEVEAGRVDIWFHVAAELALAALLVSGGIALLRGARRARLLAALALGALFYSVVNSSGYYAESADWLFVGLFAVLAVVTVAAFARLWLAGRLEPARAAAETAAPDREGVPS